MTLPQPRAPAPLTETKRSVPCSPWEALHTAGSRCPSPGPGRRPVCRQSPSLCVLSHSRHQGPGTPPSEYPCESTHLLTWFLGCRLQSQRSPTWRGTPHLGQEDGNSRCSPLEGSCPSWPGGDPPAPLAGPRSATLCAPDQSLSSPAPHLPRRPCGSHTLGLPAQGCLEESPGTAVQQAACPLLEGARSPIGEAGVHIRGLTPSPWAARSPWAFLTRPPPASPRGQPAHPPRRPSDSS